MGGCTSSNLRMPKEKQFRRAIKLYEVDEVQSMTNLLNRNRCFESGDLPITLAAREGHEAIVQTLIAGGADVNKLDKNGHGPLHLAVLYNDEETVEILLKHKANPNKYNTDNMTPLHIACDRGYVVMSTMLLEAGADPHEMSRALPPIVYAVANRHSDCVVDVLGHGADPNAYDARGNHLLYTAVVNGDVASVNALLKNGSDITAPNRDNCSLISIAAVKGIDGIILALIKYGCDPNIYNENDVPPLIGATAKGFCDSVDALLAAGAEVDDVDRRGQTALFMATMSVVDYGRQLYYCKYFSNVYRIYAKYDPVDIYPESSTKCAMSLVQAGANLVNVWSRFVQVFPNPEGVTFEQMVIAEVLIQSYGFRELPKSKIGKLSSNLLAHKEYGLVKLLYSAGVMPNSEDLFVLGTQKEEADLVMFKWVKALKCRPRQLRDLCRRKIRQLLSWNVLYLVDKKLDAPQYAKEYICIMDTEYYSMVEDS